MTEGASPRIAGPTRNLSIGFPTGSRRCRPLPIALGSMCGGVQNASVNANSIESVVRGISRQGQLPFRYQEKQMSLGLILLIVLVLALVGVIPAWGHSSSWGYGPSGGIGLILVIVLVLFLMGKI